MSLSRAVATVAFYSHRVHCTIWELLNNQKSAMLWTPEKVTHLIWDTLYILQLVTKREFFTAKKGHDVTKEPGNLVE
jgi:hypothetical protein